ncbi:MAG: acyl carrier protein [Nitrospirae bacterium]|nr:acyl carrier protein [Nitrospirota bacterium]MBF0520502.1 acyl carrier protein [Nitrospirota bacterium]MBF0535783.1 acyl carrier protein [Nitrospirota bacterium]MBF0617676.1 acyl carrier protein [Nitrospirota bacterium]
MLNETIKTIFFEVFEVSGITMDTVLNDIESWDSLNHMKLIAALEGAFSIRFTFPEIVKLLSVKKIYETIESKGVRL